MPTGNGQPWIFAGFAFVLDYVETTIEDDRPHPFLARPRAEPLKREDE